MKETEKAIYKLLKEDYDKMKHTRFTIPAISKKLKLDIETVEKSMAALWEEDSHIHMYDGPMFRYRGKTREYIQEVCDGILGAKIGTDIKKAKTVSSSKEENLKKIAKLK